MGGEPQSCLRMRCGQFDLRGSEREVARA